MAIKETGTWKVIDDGWAIAIQSNDVTYDVALTVDGDFKDLDQKLEYAEEIARRLNLYGRTKEG